MRRPGVLHGSRPRCTPGSRQPVRIVSLTAAATVVAREHPYRARPGEIAETVLLPGDPLRAVDRRDLSRRHHLLHPYAQHAGFTGTYKGKRLSVQGTGIGQPSLAIYVHELLTAYGARTLP